MSSAFFELIHVYIYHSDKLLAPQFLLATNVFCLLHNAILCYSRMFVRYWSYFRRYLILQIKEKLKICCKFIARYCQRSATLQEVWWRRCRHAGSKASKIVRTFTEIRTRVPISVTPFYSFVIGNHGDWLSPTTISWMNDWDVRLAYCTNER